MADIECPPDSLAWLELFEDSRDEQNLLACTVTKNIYAIAALYYRFRTLVSGANITNKHYILEAQSILDAADQIQPPSGAWVGLAQLQPTDLSLLHIINVFRAGLLKLQHYLLVLVDKIELRSRTQSWETASRRQRYTAATHLLSRAILDSVHHGLAEQQLEVVPSRPDVPLMGFADAMRLLFPLITVTWMTHGLQPHHDEAKRALLRIGRQLRIGLAMHCDPPAGLVIRTTRIR